MALFRCVGTLSAHEEGDNVTVKKRLLPHPPYTELDLSREEIPSRIKATGGKKQKDDFEV